MNRGSADPTEHNDNKNKNDNQPMKIKFTSLGLGLLALAGFTSQLHAQSTAFTYQGLLQQDGKFATGNYDITFWLYRTELELTPIASNSVTGLKLGGVGLFTVPVDFGNSLLNGGDAWMGITMANNRSTNYTLLQPRTQLTPAPKALYASMAGAVTNGGVRAEQLATTDAPTPGQVLAYNGSSLVWQSGGGGSSAWSLNGTNVFYNGGNVGVGTPTPVEPLHVAARIPVFALQDSDSLNSQVGLVSFRNATGVETAWLGFGNAANQNATFMNRRTFGSTVLGAGGQEWLTVSTNGNVGLGTGTPRAKLHLAGGDILAGAPGAEWIFHTRSQAGSDFLHITDSENGAPQFQRGLTLQKGGNVGIGTTSPGTRLTVAGNMSLGVHSGDYQQLRLGGGNSDGYLYGSFPALGDGIHLGYNYYADGGGIHRVLHPEAGQSRISAGYGYVALATSSANSTPINRLTVDAAGYIGIGTDTPLAPLDVRGSVRATAFNTTSDRNAKENFAPVDPQEVLEKVAALPISQWSFKDLTGTRHLGPMAQDFRAAFGLGSDDKHIATVDADGVALAAIQGLNQKVEERDRRVRELEQRLEKLERQSNEQNGGAR